MRIATIKETKAVLESDKKLLAAFLGEIRTNLLGVGSFFELINSTCVMVAASDRQSDRYLSLSLSTQT
ncbi:MAG: hypothetical protein KME46_28880 [Brasilonema angustatum HA4187-MV1]|jgi:hypothetical protein|nr:hypothetical protein [Brasilonema angustatum HA4187-MV1]